MIEVVYNKRDEDALTKGKLKLPKNIRQIGNGTGDRKIYIEDYVMSYISELARRGKERIVGVLLGENSIWEDKRYLFVKGSIKVREVIFEEGRIVLNEAAWTGIYEDIKKYFPTLAILGWFVILEDVDNLPKGSLEKTHVDNFAGNEKMLFLFETEKNEQGIYSFDNGKLVREQGYYIYYDKNENMQEYMVCNEEVKEEPVFTEIVKEKKEKVDSGKLLTFMYSVSTFLVVVVVVMAVNVMTNYEKLDIVKRGIDNIESKMVMVNGNVEAIKSTSQSTSKETMSSQTTSEAQSTTKAQTTTQVQTTMPSDSQTQTNQTKPVTTNATKVEATAKRTHKVSLGENLVIISRMYYGDDSHVDAIMKANNITNANRIYLGQELILP